MKSFDIIVGVFVSIQACRQWSIPTAVVLVIACGSLHAQSEISEASIVIIGSSDTGDAAEVYGQAFMTPATEQVIEPGADSYPLQIKSVTFYSGGMNIGSTSTRLLLVSGSSVSQDRIDYIDAVGKVRSDVVAVSTNTIDTLDIKYGDKLRFEFVEESLVQEGELISAVFVNNLNEKAVVPIPVSVAYIRFVEESPNVYRPVENIGGDQNTKVASFFADFNSDGKLDLADDASDVCFRAEFKVAVSNHLLAAGEFDVASEYKYPPNDVVISSHSAFTRTHYPKRIDNFRKYPLKAGQIVLLGDSHTEQFDWNEAILTGAEIANRGISGDTAEGVLARLDEIVASQPYSVFILIGTNDLWTEASPAQIASNIVEITSQIHTGSPNSLIYVQTIFPVRSDLSLNTKVEAINQKLSSSQGQGDYRLLDIHRLLKDEHGLLREEFTQDGVHLTVEGYHAWVEYLSGFMIEPADISP